MTSVGIRRHGRTDRATQGATENGTVTATDLVADRRAGRATNTAPDGRIQGGVPGIRCRTEQGG
jgi:hypothetical protein